MSSLQQRQRQMMAFLLHGEGAIAEHVCTTETIDGARRLSIYRNAYRIRLSETLALDHEILARYMGDDSFAELCENFIAACPSGHKSLRYFAEQLPEFLSGHYPEYPQLAELAEFERRLRFSFDAPDAKPLEPDYLAQLAPEAWPNSRFCWHPSVQLFSGHYNVVPIWQSLKQEQIPPAPIEQQSHWLIWREPLRLTQFTSVSVAEQTLLKGVERGDNLSEVCEQLLADLDEADIPAFLHHSLQRFMAAGVLCAAD